MEAFTIRDLENLTGVKAHTIRIWEQRYNFLRPQRTSTNIRYYCNDELKKILNIALLNKYGYKISTIDKMTENVLKEKILSLNNPEAQQERITHELIQAMVDMDIEGFEEVIDRQIHLRGIEKTIIHIIFPFLERVGVLWVTDNINPAQEHLISNVIRQKLIVGIDAVNSRLQVDKTVILFLPEGEHHELGLLFVSFLLKCRGVQMIYLGADVPLKDLAFVARTKKPDFVYTHITAAPNSLQLDRFIQHYCSQIDGVPLVISGRPARAIRPASPLVSLKQDFNEVISFINSI
jgi:methanogenic corrinoid protein MtbC1